MLRLECRQALVCNKRGKARNAVAVGTNTSNTMPCCMVSPQALTARLWQPTRVSPLWKALLEGEGTCGSLTTTPTSGAIKAEADLAEVAVLTTVDYVAKNVPDNQRSALLELQRLNLCQALLAQSVANTAAP